jgi:glucose dehydrogenase
MTWTSKIFWAALAAGVAFATPLRAPDIAYEWPGWGNGLRFDRFSPADQINTANVGQLRPVWKYVLAQKGNWEVTPIVIDGVMYAQDMGGVAFALDPETGRKLWQFRSGIGGRMRGVSWWRGDAAHGPRVIMGVNDRIYALDATTGKPAPDFGGSLGYIDIRDGFAKAGQNYDITSPPTVYKNLLITGPGTQEFGSHGPSGDPRAYDAITGKLVWRFNSVPRPGERNAGSWGVDGWKDRAGPSAWGMASVDVQRGLIFIPTGNPADSYIGIDRPGDNLYSDSIIAVDAATGKYRWHYQMVHHDLFDYDDASPPALVDLKVKGKLVPALVEVTKQGLMFILDRRTGKPVFGVTERPVPPSTIPGERASPTQPFPVKPLPLAKMGMTRADISTVTPESQRYCTDLWNRLGLHDTLPFEPPRLNGPNLMLPANVGGAGGVWGGVSIDPGTGMIFVNASNLPSYNYIVSDDGSAQGATAGGFKVGRAYIKFIDQNGLPCIQPPWGEMIAVNGNTGDIAWRRPLGAAEIYGDVGAHTGLVNMGGSLATAGGLVFIGATGLGYAGATQEDPVLRAFEARTGTQLWSVRLSAAAESAPMSFIGKSGRQYVVIASSGSPRPDAETSLIAFALPRAGDPEVDLHPAPLPTVRMTGVSPAPIVVTRVEDLPPGENRDTVAAACTACHGIGTALAQRHTSAEWTATIAEMQARGAKIDAPMAKRIADYLTVHFGAP